MGSTRRRSREKRKRCGTAITNQWPLKANEMFDTLRKGMLISIVGSICVCSALAATKPPTVQAGNLPVEIFQVLELPVSVSEALMVDTAKGYVLKVSLSNSTASEMT